MQPATCNRPGRYGNWIMSEDHKHECDHSEAETAKAWAKGAQDPVGEWGNAKVALDWSLEVEHYLPLAQRRQCLSPPVRCRYVRYAPVYLSPAG